MTDEQIDAWTKSMSAEKAQAAARDDMKWAIGLAVGHHTSVRDYVPIADVIASAEALYACVRRAGDAA